MYVVSGEWIEVLESVCVSAGRPDRNIPSATRSRFGLNEADAKLVKYLAKHRRLAELLQGYFYPGWLWL